jgi:hypothetical protein
MTQESQLQSEFGIEIKPIALIIKQPGGHSEERVTLTVFNPGRFTSYIQCDFKERREDHGAAAWFKKIVPYNVDVGQYDKKEIQVTAASEPEKALAGVYEIEIRVVDVPNGNRQASKIVSLRLLRVGDYAVGSGELINKTERSAIYKLPVTNNTNAPVTVRIQDPSQDKPYQFSATPITVDSSKSAAITLTVTLKEGASLPAGSSIDLSTEGEYQLIGSDPEPASKKPGHITWPAPALEISVVEPLPNELAPGDSPVLKLKLKNNSDKSHEVRLTVDGDGSNWFAPPSQPVKVGAHAEQEVEIPLKVPPERDRALAGHYALKVQAKSQTDPQATADVPVTIRVKRDGEATITPELRAIKDDQTAEYQLSINNGTNARLTLSRSASQTDTSHEFNLDPAESKVSPQGTGKTMKLTVKRAKPILRTDKFTFEMRREFQRLRDNPAIDVQHVSADWPLPIYQYYAKDPLRYLYSAYSVGPGWIQDGVAFYAFSERQAGVIPIYQYHVENSDGGWRCRLSVNSVEPGWIQDGVAFYAFKEPAGVIPIYQYSTKDSRRGYRYSTKSDVGPDWIRDAVAFYAPEKK